MHNTALFIIDDHEFFRQGIITALTATDGLSFTGEAGSVQEFLVSDSADKTDILLLDITLNNCSSLEDIPMLTIMFPNLKIILISMHNRPFILKTAVRLGISGYVSKLSPPSVLKEAIEAVSSNKKYLDSELSDSIFTILSTGKTVFNHDALYNSLTQREQVIFRMIAEGLKQDDIADKLFISRRTVRNYHSSILLKLELDTNADITALAFRLGIIDAG